MSGIANSINDMLDRVDHLGQTFNAGVRSRAARVRAVIRGETRRVASALAWSALAVLCGFAALVAGAGAILVAAWSTHPALAAALISAGFLCVACVAIVAVRNATRQ